MKAIEAMSLLKLIKLIHIPRYTRLIASIAFMAYLAAFGPAVLAQNTGSIFGSITDNSDAVLPGAKITALSSNGLNRTTTTNATGSYILPAIPIWIYMVTMEWSWFERFQDVSVSDDADRRGPEHASM